MINIYPFRITQRNRLWKPAHLNYMVYRGNRYYIFKKRTDAYRWLNFEKRFAAAHSKALTPWAIKRTRLRYDHFVRYSKAYRSRFIYD